MAMGQAFIPMVTLKNGLEMQRLALGLYNVPRDKVKELLESFLRSLLDWSLFLRDPNCLNAF